MQYRSEIVAISASLYKVKNEENQETYCSKIIV